MYVFILIFLVVVVYVFLKLKKTKNPILSDEEKLLKKVFKNKDSLKWDEDNLNDDQKELVKHLTSNIEFGFEDYDNQYTSSNTQRYVKLYFNSCNEFKELYMQSEIKHVIRDIKESFEFLKYSQKKDKFTLYLGSGYNSFIKQLEVNSKPLFLLENEIIILKTLNKSFLNIFINDCLLNQGIRIDNKNIELIKRYKRRDHIKGRYKTVYDSMETILSHIQDADNRLDVVNKIVDIKVRALKGYESIELKKK